MRCHWEPNILTVVHVYINLSISVKWRKMTRKWELKLEVLNVSLGTHFLC